MNRTLLGINVNIKMANSDNPPAFISNSGMYYPPYNNVFLESTSCRSLANLGVITILMLQQFPPFLLFCSPPPHNFTYSQMIRLEQILSHLQAHWNQSLPPMLLVAFQRCLRIRRFCRLCKYSFLYTAQYSHP